MQHLRQTRQTKAQSVASLDDAMMCATCEADKADKGPTVTKMNENQYRHHGFGDAEGFDHARVSTYEEGFPCRHSGSEASWAAWVRLKSRGGKGAEVNKIS